MRRYLLPVITAFALVVAPALTSPAAAATTFYWNGPHQTLEICEASMWAYWEGGAAVTGCSYRDLAQDWQDGWYFRHTGLP